MTAKESDRIGELQRELAANPSSRQFYQLGELLRRQGRAGEAIVVLRAGLVHHVRYVAAWVSLGRACLDMADGAGAVAALAEATQLDNQNPVAWRLAGEARLALGERPEALAAMRTALRLAPGDDVLQAAVDALEGELGPRLIEAAASPAAPSEAEGRTPFGLVEAPPPEGGTAINDVFALPALVPTAPAAVLAVTAAELTEWAPESGPSLADVFGSGAFAFPVAAPVAQDFGDVFAAVAAPAPPPARAALGEPPPDLGPFAQLPPREELPGPAPELAAAGTPEVVAGGAGEVLAAAPPALAGAQPLAAAEFGGEPLAADQVESPAVAAEPAPIAPRAPVKPAKPPEPWRTPVAGAALISAEEPVPATGGAALPGARVAASAVPLVRPTLTLARLYIQQEDFPSAIGILERLAVADPNNQEARDLLELVRDMMGPLPEALPPLSVRERKIAALQGWLASLTLGRERISP